MQLLYHWSLILKAQNEIDACAIRGPVKGGEAAPSLAILTA